MCAFGRKVHDAWGRGIADATVEVIDKNTGEIVKTITTTPSGNYEAYVHPGPYWIRTGRHGMYAESTKSVDVNAGEAKQQNVYQARQPFKPSKWFEKKAKQLNDLSENSGLLANIAQGVGMAMVGAGTVIMRYSTALRHPALVVGAFAIGAAVTKVGYHVATKANKYGNYFKPILQAASWVSNKIGGFLKRWGW